MAKAPSKGGDGAATNQQQSGNQAGNDAAGHPTSDPIITDTDQAAALVGIEPSEPLITDADQAAALVGIEPDQVFSHRLYSDRVVVVTRDGRKLEAAL